MVHRFWSRKRLGSNDSRFSIGHESAGLFQAAVSRMAFGGRWNQSNVTPYMRLGMPVLDIAIRSVPSKVSLPWIELYRDQLQRTRWFAVGRSCCIRSKASASEQIEQRVIPSPFM